jgi:hypothetical protein
MQSAELLPPHLCDLRTVLWDDTMDRGGDVLSGSSRLHLATFLYEGAQALLVAALPRLFIELLASHVRAMAGRAVLLLRSGLMVEVPHLAGLTLALPAREDLGSHREGRIL